MSLTRNATDIGVRSRAERTHEPTDRPVVPKSATESTFAVRKQAARLRRQATRPPTPEPVDALEAAQAAFEWTAAEHQRDVERRTAAWRDYQVHPSAETRDAWRDAEVLADSSAAALSVAQADLDRARGTQTTLDATPLMTWMGHSFRAFSGPFGLLTLRRR